MKIKKNTNYLIETKEDLQDFLERCEKKGWKWQTQDSPLDFTPDEIPCVIIYDTKSPREGLAGSFRTGLYDKIYKRKTPPTLAEFLGWEEEVEYDDGKDTLLMIIDGVLHYRSKEYFENWNPYAMFLRDDKFSELREFKKAQPKLYHAKVKGWELASGSSYYWNHYIEGDLLAISTKFEMSVLRTTYTIPEWNYLGINDTNADFEEVVE